jgi:hypothetical protein
LHGCSDSSSEHVEEVGEIVEDGNILYYPEFPSDTLSVQGSKYRADININVQVQIKVQV